jgi:protein phosphatase
LLRPARVDPDTGYRYYAPGQLEQARLVAWLRRLGMPLARIREVCAQDAQGAARGVREYWAEVEADTAARRELAAFLVDHLSQLTHASGKDGPDMNNDPGTPGVRLRLSCAALTDTGLVRLENQDAVHAGSRVLAVADGFGPRGGPASAAAVAALRALEDAPEPLTGPQTAGSSGTAVPDTAGPEPARAPVPAGEILNVLDDAVQEAVRAVRDAAHGHHAPEESGSTLTALVWSGTGSRLALVHIGDCRAYLLRAGELYQITHDHTLVQSMIDDGRLTPAEAAAHPQRSLLLKALVGTAPQVPEVRLREARLGDRYVLCSDGLSTVLPPDELRRVVTAAAAPQDAVHELIDLVRAAGAPDNVSCVIADVTRAPVPAGSPAA